MSRKLTKIAIIGAGISGVGAAEKLQKLGFTNYIVLEATDRIGGRMRTHYDTDREGNPYKLELGAQWIHGTKNNPVNALAQKHGFYQPLCEGVSTHNPHSNRTAVLNVTENGETVPDHIHRAIRKKYASLEDKCDDFFNEGLPNGLVDDISIEEYIRSEIKATVEGFEGRDRELAQQALESILAFQTGISGCDSMAQVSLRQIGSYEELSGSQPSVHQGYEKVVSALAQDIPADKILLGHAVQRLEWKNTQDKRETNVKVICESGACFDVDCAIVTASLGCLKAHSARLFDPPLPEKKRNAIEALGIDAVDKIFLWYDDLDFLPNGVGRIQIGRSTDSIKSAQGPQWANKIHSFHMERQTSDKILVCWITGRAAESMESLSSQEVARGCTEVLRRVLTNPDVPLPVKVLKTDWYSNPHTLGAYTYIPVGATVNHIQDLAEPLVDKKAKPILLFAGEATHPSYYSTVHGALLTGWREAERIAEVYTTD